MSNTLLEETRQQHEDMERLERLIVQEFRRDIKTHKEKLLQGYRVRHMLNTLQQRAKRLTAVYEDADGSRKEDIAALRGDNVFANFYDRLKDARNYHRRFGGTDELTGAPEDVAASLVGPDPPMAFSGEESMGRFLDLHELHHTWQNAKFGGQVDYAAYVAALPSHLETVPREKKGSAQYKQYVAELASYLEGFYQRSQPLAQLERQLARLEADFSQRWEAGEVLGWEDRGNGPAKAAAASEDAAIDLADFSTVEELEVVGADRLKAALNALGLKCGGSPRQRAERLMATKGKRVEDLPAAMFAKGPRRAAASAPELSERAKAVAWGEARIGWACETLAGVIGDTLGRIEKRQSQTYEEMVAEAEEEEEEGVLVGDDEEEDDEDEYVYNPLKLPMGWDGKPIPYWLYKLHGLNLEFKCEICGGASYWGRRAFERHFKEPRHEAGMKALGIPNSRQFFEVTTITDAMALWKSLREREAGGFKAEEDEEYEDAQGNVFSKKIYTDLQRQGIL